MLFDRLSFRNISAAAVVSIAVITAACSGSGGTARTVPVTTPTPAPTATPTPSPSHSPTATPTASPKPSSSPGTPTPTASATATAVPTHTPTPAPTPTHTPTPTATPSSGPVGNLSCTAPTVSIPTNALSILTSGNVSGSTYTMDASSAENLYLVFQYTNATPTPTPTVTPTPHPTATPTVTPTPAPTATPTPEMVTLYYGEYSWAPFSGTGLPPAGASYSVPAGSGCFTLIVHQPVGAAFRQSRAASRRPAQAAPADNALGSGTPKLPTPEPAATILDEGPLTSLTINNLTASSGSGSFTFSTSKQGVTGSITITGSQTFTGVTVDRARFAYQARQLLLQRTRTVHVRGRR